jgi:probable HAF family extracellular repeat protein
LRPEIDLRRLTSGTHVFPAGLRTAVPRATIRKLKRLAQEGAAPNVIRYQLANANRMAAQSPGWRQRGLVVCGFVWSPTLGVIDILGEEGRAFYPCAINDSGVVVGESDDGTGKRRAFRWSAQDGPIRLHVADDFHPSDIAEIRVAEVR